MNVLKFCFYFFQQNLQSCVVGGCGLIIHVETLFPDLKVKERCEGEFTFFMFFLSENLGKDNHSA